MIGRFSSTFICVYTTVPLCPRRSARCRWRNHRSLLAAYVGFCGITDGRPLRDRTHRVQGRTAVRWIGNCPSTIRFRNTQTDLVGFSRDVPVLLSPSKGAAVVPVEIQVVPDRVLVVVSRISEIAVTLA